MFFTSACSIWTCCRRNEFSRLWSHLEKPRLSHESKVFSYLRSLFSLFRVSLEPLRSSTMAFFLLREAIAASRFLRFLFNKVMIGEKYLSSFLALSRSPSNAEEMAVSDNSATSLSPSFSSTSQSPEKSLGWSRQKLDPFRTPASESSQHCST